MKNHSSFQYLILILLGIFNLFTTLHAQSNSRSEIEKARLEIIREIDKTSSLLEETSKNKKALLSDVQLLENQIKQRGLLIDQTQKEIGLLESDLLKRKLAIQELETKLDSLTAQYNIVLRALYREKKKQNIIIQLFSPKSVRSSFFKRNYLNRLKSITSQKFENIQTNKTDLINEKNELLNEQDQLKMEIESILDQKNLLAQAKLKQADLLKTMSRDEEELRSLLEEQRAEREVLNRAIESVIRSNFDGVPEPGKSENNIAKVSNLIWPVEGGIIYSSFGKQRHPSLKNIFINNKGIDLRAPISSKVVASESGTVVSVSEHTGFGKMIILEHGSFYTVYSKLKEVLVKKGDKVKRTQLLGTLSTNNNSSELHFELWINEKAVNPEEWLK